MTSSTIPFQRLIEDFRDAAAARRTATQHARRLTRHAHSTASRRAIRALAYMSDADAQVTQASNNIQDAGGRVEWGSGNQVRVYDRRGHARLTLTLA